MIEEEKWKTWKITYGTNWKTNKKWIVSIWEISNYGKVKRNGELVHCNTDNEGRVYIGHTKYRVHRVVAELFIGPIPEGYVIDHIDGNPSNNKVDNLKICTQKENIHNPITFERFLNTMSKRSGDIEYSNIMKEAAKKRRSYKGIENPMFGKEHPNKNKHREYDKTGKYHYVNN